MLHVGRFGCKEESTYIVTAIQVAPKAISWRLRNASACCGRR